MSDVDTTELDLLDASKVSGVEKPANGMGFVLIKAAKDDSGPDDKPADGDEKDGDWWDKNKSKVTAKSDSAEADEIEAEVTKDEASDIEEELTGGKDDAEKSAVQDSLGGTNKPEETGHLDTGQSQTSGTVTAGTRPGPSNSSLSLGGGTTANIPDVTAVDQGSPTPTTTDAAGTVNSQATKSFAVASLVEAMEAFDLQRTAIKDGKYLQVANPTSAESSDPGSMPWESYDSASLAQVAQCLAGCCNALDSIQQREAVEAASGNPSDQRDVWDLEDASCALNNAMAIAARLAFQEAAEGASVAVKAYKRLNVGDTKALSAARDHLSAVLDGAEQTKASSASSDDEGVINVADVTKEELAETIAASSVAAVKAVLKAGRKADKKAAKAAAKIAAEEAEKNANNGGDIDKPAATSETDANNVNAVGGAVNGEYVNKGEAEDGADAGSESLSKEVADQLEALTKGLASVEETVAKFAKRPRAGGPSLDGQARGVAPAAEGRMSDVSKSADDLNVETLQKQLDEATDPVQKSELGLKLTHARLVRAHEAGQL